jgi:CBS-domain-containing membrane protein
MDRSRITKATLIRQVRDILSSDLVLVSPDDDLHQLANKVVAAGQNHTLCVVDAERKLLGLIPLESLLNSVFYHIVPEELLGEMSDYEEAVAVAKLSSTKTAKDLMIAPVSLRDDDRVRDAFVRMHASHCLEGLPVVDEANRVVAFVSMLELLSVWADEGENPGAREKKSE